jgi:hypothetical protein
MRHNPAAGAIIMVHAVSKCTAGGQAVGELTEQGSSASKPPCRSCHPRRDWQPTIQRLRGAAHAATSPGDVVMYSGRCKPGMSERSEHLPPGRSRCPYRSDAQGYAGLEDRGEHHWWSLQVRSFSRPFRASGLRLASTMASTIWPKQSGLEPPTASARPASRSSSASSTSSLRSRPGRASRSASSSRVTSC